MTAHVPLELTWYDVAIRLALTILAGALIGLNRSESGRPAGLRTNILVAIAAAVAMIEANYLASMRGKQSDSFIQLDTMRLPLGILTGMGFIGGGVILRRRHVIHGVTTAASLWLVTTIGLCFGAGLLGLGIAELTVALVVLWSLKWIEMQVRQDRRAILTFSSEDEAFSESNLQLSLRAVGFAIETWDVVYRRREKGRRQMVRCQVRWRARADEREVPVVVRELALRPDVRGLRWSG
jgi:putative Mg2+ transporter-C (MgtC) family protein